MQHRVGVDCEINFILVDKKENKQEKKNTSLQYVVRNFSSPKGQASVRAYQIIRTYVHFISCGSSIQEEMHFLPRGQVLFTSLPDVEVHMTSE